MPRWYRRLSTFSIIFAQEVLTTTAALSHREPSDTKVKVLQARGTNVLQDKYFIPAIATIGAFVLLSLVCLYYLGCCCNSRKMDEYYSRTAPPTRNSAAYPRPINPNPLDGSDKYSNATPPQPPHPIQVSNSSSPTPPSVRLEQLEAQRQNENQRFQMVPPTSHGFQPVAHTVNSSVMSVRHLNPTAASYPNRPYERPQVPRSHEPSRLSSMSSATSSTQIGSGAGEQAPYLYSPHQGNTLSYASSAAPSVGAPAWDASGMPRMPDNENLPPMVAPERNGHDQQTPIHSRPPAYFADGNNRTADKKS